MNDENDSASADEDALKSAIGRLPLAMVLTDPNADDNPIIYVNRAFEKVTLYSSAFAVGRNCRFLQGDDTDPAVIEKLAQAVAAEEDTTVDIKNYKADGTPFMNRLVIAPIRDDKDRLTGFLGVQRELEPDGRDRLPERPEQDVMLREVQHRVKNHLAMIVSMVRLQAAKKITKDSFEALGNRIEALALLYDELSGSGLASVEGGDTVPAGAYLSRVCSALTAIEGRGSIRVNVECEQIELPVEKTARLGLLLTEFLTNALEHAFEGRDEGVIRVRFQRLTGGGVRLMVEDDGIGLPEGSNWPEDSRDIESYDRETKTASGTDLDTRGHDGRSGMGGSIVRALVGSLNGRLDVNSVTAGTIITLDVA